MLTATSKTRATKLSRVSTFLLYTYFFSLTHKHKSNEQSTPDSNSSISVTIHHYANIHTKFFLTITDTPTSKIVILLPESPCTLYSCNWRIILKYVANIYGVIFTTIFISRTYTLLLLSVI